MFTMNNKKQPPEVFYNKAVLKNFSILTKIPVPESLPNQVAALQISNLFKKRFQRRCFLVNIAKLFIHEDCKIGVKCFSTLAEKHLYWSVFLIKYSCWMQLKPIFIQKEVPALVFSRQLSEISNNNVF